MSSQLTLRARKSVSGDAQSIHDFATGETVKRYTHVELAEDFCGPGHAAIPAAGSPSVGYAWVKKTVQSAGSPSAAQVANYSGGLVRLALDATSEKQEASLYANDSLSWDATKSAIFEARISNHVVPTGVAEVVFGLRSAWIDGPDNASEYIDFQQSASGVVNFRAKDGVSSAQSHASSIVMAVDTFHVFRIDATSPTNIRFFIDGKELNTPGQVSFAATGASAVLQPYASVYKASGVGVGTLDVDMIQLAMNRS